MDFKTAARLASYLAKDYAEDFFGLLTKYHDISASEAASRLDLHIRTAQDFLDGLVELGIVSKQEVHEKKRPYYRYSLEKQVVNFKLDLTKTTSMPDLAGGERLVRERAGAGARFSPARDGQSINTVTIWVGEGRERKERKISLTPAQGKFLYYLPFPNAERLSVAEIMAKAKVDEEFSLEILDLVDLLEKYGVIQVQ
jgi:predicted transcriptional regulator